MTRLKPKFTKSNALAVAAAVVGAAGLGYAVWRLASDLMLKAHVRAEVPRIYEHACEQRERLVAAISAYRSNFGFYPLDHVISKEPMVVDAVTNQLFYELWGRVFDPHARNFTPLLSSVHLSEGLVQKFFDIDRFKNSAETTNGVKCFLSETETLMEVHDRPETIGVLSFWPTWPDANWEAIGQIRFGTWQYNSSRPLHNPKGFDLWVEIQAPGTNIVIGNW